MENFDLEGVVPLPQCHSHNDYEQRIPLFSAISQGCASVEADVWMLDGGLYVAHDTDSLNWNRTLKGAYIDPLLRLLDNNNGDRSNSSAVPYGIFNSDPFQTLVLLIDFKQSIDDLFDLVQENLRSLRSKQYLSYWDSKEFISGPITVVLTGSAPFERILESSQPRDVFYDAPLHALQTVEEDKSWDSTGSVFNVSNSFYASTDFKKVAGLWWRSPLSHTPTSIIRDQIQTAKLAGLRSRYWGTPAWPVWLRNYIWRVLLKEGIDVLNVDDLGAAKTIRWRN